MALEQSVLYEQILDMEDYEVELLYEVAEEKIEKEQEEMSKARRRAPRPRRR